MRPPLRSRWDLCPLSDSSLLRCLRPRRAAQAARFPPCVYALPPVTHGGSKSRHVVSTGPDTNTYESQCTPRYSLETAAARTTTAEALQADIRLLLPGSRDRSAPVFA